MKKEKFDVQGMTCSSCTAHVEKAVKDLGGAISVNVNLLLNCMVVEFDENELNENQIITAVKEAGYDARISAHNSTISGINNGKNVESNNSASNSDENRNEYSINGGVRKVSQIDLIKETMASMKHRLIVSISFLIPLIYLSMNHMFNEAFGIPIPGIISKTFHGLENALILGFTELLLLLPIIYVNRNYFIVGFKRLFKKAPNMDSLIAIGSSASILYGIFVIYLFGYGLGHGDIELVKKYQMDLYFESAGMILTLITVGKYLETKSKGKTTEAITKLAKLVPQTANVVRGDHTEIVEIENIVVRRYYRN